MCVKRSKALPFGGGMLDADLLAEVGSRLTMAAVQARTRSAVGMTASARDIWASVYPTISEGMPGLFGAVTARSEAQCIRLALIYALLDGAGAIDDPHLLAALAVWERASTSARFIFGSALGDAVADEILRALRVAGARGMTRTEISHLFRRHKSAEQIGAALDLLTKRSLVCVDRQPTDGRTSEIWRARGAK